MNREDVKETPDLVEKQDEGPDTLRLELDVTDRIVVQYLARFEERVRNEKALEALKVGVIAIQSASPSLDTRVVEERFREVQKRISDCVSGFSEEVRKQLDEYFKAGSGSLPRSLETLFGENGKLTTALSQYFGTEDGKLTRIIQEQVGPSSQFARSLDPTNKESVISHIENVVQNHLNEKTAEIVSQFSLDTDDSALARLRREISSQVEAIKKSNNEFFAELRESLGIKAGREKEAEKGTEKGREFETALYERVAELGRQLGDSTENVRGLVGAVQRSKKGDYIISLGETSGAPGCRIVVEAKKQEGYRLKEAIDELKEAKQNRAAAAGIFAFARGYEPPEVGDFHRIGEDFFVTVDEESLEKGGRLLGFEYAYKIARALVVTTVRREEKQELDLEKVLGELNSLSELVKRLSELSSKARTISTNSAFIEQTANYLKEEMETHLKEIEKLLSRPPTTSQSSAAI